MRVKGRCVLVTLGISALTVGLLVGWSQGPLIKCISVDRESPHPLQKPAGVGVDDTGSDAMLEEDAPGWKSEGTSINVILVSSSWSGSSNHGSPSGSSKLYKTGWLIKFEGSSGAIGLMLILLDGSCCTVRFELERRLSLERFCCPLTFMRER